MMQNGNSLEKFPNGNIPGPVLNLWILWQYESLVKVSNQLQLNAPLLPIPSLRRLQISELLQTHAIELSNSSNWVSSVVTGNKTWWPLSCGKWKSHQAMRDSQPLLACILCWEYPFPYVCCMWHFLFYFWVLTFSFWAKLNYF